MSGYLDLLALVDLDMLASEMTDSASGVVDIGFPQQQRPSWLERDLKLA
jgi:hypothetical protein